MCIKCLFCGHESDVLIKKETEDFAVFICENCVQDCLWLFHEQHKEEMKRVPANGSGITGFQEQN